MFVEFTRRTEHTMAASVAAGTGAGSVENTITIKEALEAAALTIVDKAVDQSNAGAVQAADVRATGYNEKVPGSIAAAAQAAANAIARVVSEQDKATLGDVLTFLVQSFDREKDVTGVRIPQRRLSHVNSVGC